MTVNVDGQGCSSQRRNHTYVEPTQSLDGCHRQALLLVTAQRGRQTTLCHGLAETDISPRGSGSDDLGHGWGRDSGETGEALSTLGKGPMLLSIEVHSQRHFAVGTQKAGARLDHASAHGSRLERQNT